MYLFIYSFENKTTWNSMLAANSVNTPGSTVALISLAAECQNTP